LGGLINYVVNRERWNNDPFFKEYVVNYTNAAAIISEAFKDSEELDGVFSGLMEYTPSGDAWPYDGFVGRYDNASWQYKRGGPPPEPRARTEQPSGTEQQSEQHPPGPPFNDLIRSLRKPSPERDETLQHPMSVFQIVKRHFSRYTPQTSPKFPLHIWLAKPTLCGYTRPLSGESATNVRLWRTRLTTRQNSAPPLLLRRFWCIRTIPAKTLLAQLLPILPQTFVRFMVNCAELIQR